MTHGEWDAFVAYYGKVIDRWSGESVMGKDQFETLKKAIWREAKIEALKEFIEGMEKEALDTND